jgi:hypothetical protein
MGRIEEKPRTRITRRTNRNFRSVRGRSVLNCLRRKSDRVVMSQAGDLFLIALDSMRYMHDATRASCICPGTRRAFPRNWLSLRGRADHILQVNFNGIKGSSDCVAGQLCVPSSVEAFERDSSLAWTSLGAVAFESGSHLSHIGDYTFCGCR